MKAMILAAGLGTRLRPMTDELPKPLVWVGDRPVVAHIAERLAASGITEVAINTHHLADAFTPEILASLPVRLTVLHEREILGTAGGVANAGALLGEGDALTWNGDILADVDLAALVAAHRAAHAIATLAVAPRPVGEGNVGLDADGLVVRLRGERFGREVAGAYALGIQVIGRALRRALPAVGCMAEGGYLPALRAGELIASIVVAGPWDDIGTIDAYLAANARWLEQSGRAAYVGDGARVAPGIDVTGSVIGRGAEVSGAGPVRRSVIWPGARAEAPLDRAVVTTAGTIVHAPQ
jgi:mannose-1-phosphate guanylyltransferase